MAKRKKKAGKSPADQAKSPINGVAPPVDKRWKKGQSGNPKGRPTAGASIREWWNVMQDWSTEQLAEVIADKKSPAVKVAAARALTDACSSDRNAAGQPIAGADLDRIIEHTAGRPKQAVELTGKDGGPIKTKGDVDYDAIEAELREIATAAAGVARGTQPDDRPK